MPDYTTMKGFSDIGLPSPVEIIEDNIKVWMDWSFLTKGAYFNYQVNSSGAYNQSWSELSHSVDPNFDSGTVWQGHTNNWVWETGVGRSQEPIRVSGIWVDGQFRFFSAQFPNAENKIDGYVDYVNGRVILNSGISTDSTVKASFSARYIHTYMSYEVPMFNSVQYGAYRSDNSQFRNAGSGDWSTVGNTRIQLPAVVIEIVEGSNKPFQLGGGHYCYNDVICHVMSEDGPTCKRLGFYLSQQFEKSIYLFDPYRAIQSGVMPLDYRGMVVESGHMYPDLVDYYRYKKLTILDTRKPVMNKVHQNLYITPVRLTTEVILPGN